MDAPPAPEVCRTCGVALDGDDESIAHYSARTSVETYRDRAKRPEATDGDMASAIAAESNLKAQCALVKAEREAVKAEKEVAMIEKRLEEGPAKRQRTEGDEASNADWEPGLKELEKAKAEVKEAKAEVEKAEAKAEKANEKAKAEVKEAEAKAEKAKAEENLRAAEAKAAASHAAKENPDSTVAQQVEAQYDKALVSLRKAELAHASAVSRGDIMNLEPYVIGVNQARVEVLNIVASRFFKEQSIVEWDARLSDGNSQHLRAVKSELRIVDQGANLEVVVQQQDRDLPPFEWGPNDREDAQYEQYTEYLKDNFPIGGDGAVFAYVATGDRHKNVLSTKVCGNLGFKGTSDVFVCLPITEGGLIDAQRIVAVIKMKTKVKIQQSLEKLKTQCVGELLAASTLSRWPVVAVLTDLGSVWHFWWLGRGGGGDAGLGLVHHHAVTHAHGSRLWRAFCARFARVNDAEGEPEDQLLPPGGGGGGGGGPGGEDGGGGGDGNEGRAGDGSGGGNPCPGVALDACLAGCALTVLGAGGGAQNDADGESPDSACTGNDREVGDAKQCRPMTEKDLTEMLHMSPDDDADTRWAQAQQLRAWYYSTQGFEYSATEGAVRPSDAASKAAEKRSLGGQVLSGQAAVPPQERVESYLATMSNEM